MPKSKRNKLGKYKQMLIYLIISIIIWYIFDCIELVISKTELKFNHHNLLIV